MAARSYSLLLILGLAGSGWAEPPAPAAGGDRPPAATDEEPAEPTPGAPAPRAAPPAPRVIFRPSETISEDTAVPFPADI
ncbi:MAG: hypothetical protein ACOY42_10895 [Pseudomonadota bacterium]